MPAPKNMENSAKPTTCLLYTATGGMATKLKAAQIVTEVGCQMVSANGSKPALLYDIVGGKPVGTRFLAKEK